MFNGKDFNRICNEYNWDISYDISEAEKILKELNQNDIQDQEIWHALCIGFLEGGDTNGIDQINVDIQKGTLYLQHNFGDTEITHVISFQSIRKIKSEDEKVIALALQGYMDEELKSNIEEYQLKNLEASELHLAIESFHSYVDQEYNEYELVNNNVYCLAIYPKSNLINYEYALLLTNLIYVSEEYEKIYESLSSIRSDQPILLSEKLNTMRRLLEYLLKLEILYTNITYFENFLDAKKKKVNKKNVNDDFLNYVTVGDLVKILPYDQMASPKALKSLVHFLNNYSHDKGMPFNKLKIDNSLISFREYIEDLGDLFAEYPRVQSESFFHWVIEDIEWEESDSTAQLKLDLIDKNHFDNLGTNKETLIRNDNLDLNKPKVLFQKKKYSELGKDFFIKQHTLKVLDSYDISENLQNNDPVVIKSKLLQSFKKGDEIVFYHRFNNKYILKKHEKNSKDAFILEVEGCDFDEK